MMNQLRIIDGYAITNSIRIGDREVVLGENREDLNGLMYMCGLLCPQDIFETPDLKMSGADFFEVLQIAPPVLERKVAGSDYLTILHLYHEYIRQQKDRVAWELSRLPFRDRVYTEIDCCEESQYSELLGETVILHIQSLQPEYRMGNFQIVLVTGGDGVLEDAPNSAVLFGETLFTGKRGVWRRGDVLGILCANCYPDWLIDLMNRQETDARQDFCHLNANSKNMVED